MIIYAKEKKERSLGEKLFLKAYRCNSPKCAMMRKPHRPGAHGKGRQKVTDFGTQLKVKQKFKVSYGVTEGQLHSIFKEAVRSSSVTGEKIMELLERRLDSALFRAGLVDSRIMARQFITRGHIKVNGHKTTSPSYSLHLNDVVSVRPESKETSMFKDRKEKIVEANIPTWIQVDKDKLEAKVVALPHGVDPPFDVGLMIEYFAKNN